MESRPLMILLIGNNLTQIMEIEEILNLHRPYSFSLEIALSMETGLKRLEESSFDLILLIHNPPKIDGFEVLERIKKSGFTTPTTVILDEEDSKTAFEFIKAGVSSYLFRERLKRGSLPPLLNALFEIRYLKRTIEKLKSLEEAEGIELRKIDELKKKIITTASYEFIRPLTSLVSYSELLLDLPDEEKGGSLQREFLEIIHEEGIRLGRLINGFMNLSLIESGRMEWDIKEVSINEVVSSSLKTIHPLIRQRGIELNVNLAKDLPMVMADMERLKDVIIALLSNAIKLTPSGGRIYLETQPYPGDMVQVKVIDTGKGIAKEDLERVSSWLKEPCCDILGKKPEGIDLDLAISKEIINYHAGRMWVESEWGKGSTFSFILPVGKEFRPERRRYRRIKKEINLSYSLPLISEKERFNAQICELGARGIRIRSDVELKREEILLLDFEVPLIGGPKRVKILGEVIWTKGPEDGKYLAGIEFLRGAKSLQDKINQYVEFQLRA